MIEHARADAELGRMRGTREAAAHPDVGAGAATRAAPRAEPGSAAGASDAVGGAAFGPVPEVASALRQRGLVGALALLNGRTRYRFTGVYRVEPPLLRNVCLFDRENPTVALAGDINPLCDTYCGIVSASATPFATGDGSADARVDPRVARGGVLSYLGVPIRDRDGRVAGTLCHFDCRPRLVPDGEPAVLARVVAALGARLLDG